MAPPNPPPSSHQTTAADAPKRRKHRRHAPQLPQQPEEPPSPALMGRENGSTPLPTKPSTNVRSGCSDLNSAVREAGTTVQTRMGERNEAGLQVSPSLEDSSAAPAVCTVPGRPVLLPRTSFSGDLGKKGRRGRVEGAEGLAGLLPGSATPQASGNGGPLKSGEILTEGAHHVFDDLSVRSPSLIPSKPNAGTPLRPGVLPVPPTARDASVEEAGRGDLAPVRAGRAGDHHCTHRQTRLPDFTETDSGQICHDFRQLGGTTEFVPLMGGLRGQGGTQEGRLDCSPWVVREANAPGRGNGALVNAATQIAALQVQPRHVLEQLKHAPDFSSFLERPLEQGGILEDHVGCVSDVVPGAMVQGQHIATPSKDVTIQPAAQSEQASRRQLHSVWGHTRNPCTGGWSPDYREAFPSLHGDAGDSGGQPRGERDGFRGEADQDASLKKIESFRKIPF